MEGLVTLVFFKIKSTNLTSWGILMQIFQQVRYSKFKASMTSVCSTFGCQKNINMLFLDFTCYHGNYFVESTFTKIIKITKLCNFYSHL